MFHLFRRNRLSVSIRRAHSARSLTKRLCLERLEERTLLNAGTLDSSFGSFGEVMTPFPGAGTTADAAAVVSQPDGKIVVAGTATTAAPSSQVEIGLARYNSDGSLDSTFGNGGLVTTPVPTSGQVGPTYAASRIVLQPDGKIVVVGSPDLARYLPNGSLDTTFGNGGLVALSMQGLNRPNLVLQPDGKILVVGSNLERFNTDGSLDGTFGTSGQVTLSSAESGIALQPDGRIVVAGSFLARFNSDGSSDSTFGASGQVNLSFTAAYGALQADGRIVATGGNTVARFNVNGSPDATFGKGGSVTTPSIYGGEGAATVLIQRDDKIIALGSTGGGRQASFELDRYNPNGSLDATFGTNGDTIQSNGYGDGANDGALPLGSAGPLLAVGGSGGTLPHVFIVFRYTADPPITDPNQKFLTQVYLDLLQRPLDPDGLSIWSNALASGATRTQVVAAIESSQEYHAVEVQKLYGLLLSRAAEPAGLNIWVSFLDQGGTFEQMEAMILGSDEYFAGHGGGTNDGFLKAMYADVLNRPTDPGSKNWSQALASGASRTSIAVGVLGSSESDTDEVQTIYRQLLRRAADSSGLHAFTQALQQGVPNEAMIAVIAGSDEYFGRL